MPCYHIRAKLYSGIYAVEYLWSGYWVWVCHCYKPTWCHRAPLNVFFENVSMQALFITSGMHLHVTNLVIRLILQSHHDYLHIFSFICCSKQVKSSVLFSRSFYDLRWKSHVISNYMGTGIRGLMRGMATLSQGNQELLVVRDKVGRPRWAWGKQVHGMWYFPFSTLALSVGQQEGHPACKKTGCWFAGGDDLTGALHDL